MSGRGQRGARWLGWFLGGLGIGALVGSGLYVATADEGAGGEGVAGGRPAVAGFVEETIESGVRHAYDGEFVHFVGGGLAVFDCDDDRQPDLFIAGGANESALFRNQSEVSGALRFEQVEHPATGLDGVSGAYPVDVDADGITDLAVLRVGENVMLRGLGGCRFERANEAWGVDGGAEWTAAFSATWEDADARPTLAFGNYLEIEPRPDNSRRCVPSVLLRPQPGTDAYSAPMPLASPLCTLSVLFADWDATGRHDLRMANDRHYFREGGEQLWRIETGQEPELYTAADGWKDLTIWGMGIAVRDVTGDGLSEVVITSQGDNKMQTLSEGDGYPSYSDIAIRVGTTAHRPFTGDQTYRSTAWHPEFADVNNDGFIDLFLSKGNVDTQIDHAADDPSNLLLGSADGTFVESARDAGVVSTGLGRGAALVDLNLDGMLDLVEVNRAENVRLWRNVGGGDAEAPEPLGNWVAVSLEQPGANRDAAGAWLDVQVDGRVDTRQVTVGGGHAGGQLGWIHAGIGEAESAQVRVRWPDGEQTDWMDVEANAFAILGRGADVPQIWLPPTS